MSSKRRDLQRGLSSLSSHINEWTEADKARKTDQPLKKRQQIYDRSSRGTITEFSGANLPETHAEWYQAYEPTTSDELALHKRKLSDVKTILESMIAGKSETRILLLIGPAGCSKSTSIKVLSNELVPLYRTNSNIRSELKSEPAAVLEYDSSNLPVSASKTDHFDNFLTESKYRIGSNLSVLLVEDLPNVFHSSTRSKFQKALLRWLFSSQERLPPLVISLTECEIQSSENRGLAFSIDTHFIAETVIGRDILTHPRLKRLKYNPVNKTLLRKHLNAICAQERSSFAPGKWNAKDVFINKITENCGDLRSAISSLQLWAASKEYDIPEGKIREQAVSYFQGLGRVLFGSKEIPNDNQMMNQLMNSSHMGLGDNLKLGILENYGTFNKQQFPLKCAVDIVDSLSLSDTMALHSSAQKEGEALEFPCRLVRDAFSKLRDADTKAESFSHSRPNYPRESRVQSLSRGTLLDVNEFAVVELSKYGNSHCFKDIVLDFAFFAPFIRRRQNFKRKALEHYVRSLTNSTERQKALSRIKDIGDLDDSVDFFDRLGGEMSIVGAVQDVIVDNTESSPRRSGSKINALRNKQHLIEGTAEEDTFLDEDMLDPIIDSEDDSFSDDDDELYDLLASQSPRKPTVALTGL